MAVDTGLPPQGTQDHVYTQPGTYTVTLTDEQDGTKTTQIVIVVPFGPVMTVQEDPNDADRRSVLVTVDNFNQGAVILDWGDGGRTSNNSGDGQEETRHRYLQPGKYMIKASDADEPSRTATFEVTVPFTQPKPILTITEDTSDPNRLSINVTVDNHGEGPVSIGWGDSTAAVENPGDGTTVSPHTYAGAGTYTVRATDVDNPALTASQQVTVPFTAVLWDFETVEDTSDPNRLSVTLTVTDPTDGVTYEVNWGDGDGQTWADIPAGDPMTANHAYAAAGTFDIEVRDKATPTDTRTHPVTVPFGTPFQLAEDDTDTTRMTATVTVSNPQAGVSYEVQWDAEQAWEALAGDPPSGTHQYAAAGDAAVTVRVVDDPDTATTQNVTVPFTEAITLATTEDAGDATRMTARTTVTDPVEGATYEVQWDGGGGFTALPTDSTPPHSATNQYAAAGAKVVTVRKVGNTNVAATSNVTVAFTGPQFTITQGANAREVHVEVTDDPAAAAYDIAWDEGGTPEALTGTPPAADHPYPQAEDGTHVITVRSDPSGTPVPASQQVTTPLATAVLGTAAASTTATTTRKKRAR